ncbi:MAG: GntR family transcriptional regulator [Inquilinaceae bacterium]
MPQPQQARYRQIASALEADIMAGRLKVGDQIPSERAMAERMGISRMTARKALEQLAGRGILETRVGQGTFVGTPVIEQELSALSGFSEDMARQGRTTSSIVVEAERRDATVEAIRSLGLAPRSEVYRLTRVRLADGTPVAVERTEIDAARAPDLLSKADFSKASLYANLKDRYGITPATADQTLEAALADSAMALMLRLEVGAPVLRQTRLTRDTDGRPFEFVRSTYRGDAFVMRVHLTVGMEGTR